MKLIAFLLLALLLLFTPGCADTGDDNESNEPMLMFPDYSVINTPSRDPQKPWYISDFFQRVEGWRLEATVDLNELELGMYELTQYPDQAATQEDRDAAEKLVKDSVDAAMRHGWFSKEKGLSDGYQGMFKDPVHFVNKEFVYDGETLNPDKPEVLMYYRTDEGEFLMGVMYIAAGQRGPQVAGPLSKWHFHIDRRVCYEVGMLPIGRIREGGRCATGIPNSRSPEMLHVWFFDRPEGRFATSMGLSPEQLKTGVKQILALQNEQS